MFERDFLYKKAKKSKTEEDWIIVRRVKNLCNSSVRMAKENYTKLLLKTHEKDPYKFWKVLEYTWASNKGNSSSIINLIDQTTGTQVPPQNIPNFFNDHLGNVGARLTSQFENAPPFLSTYRHNLESFKLKSICPWEVRDLVKGIKTTKSSAIEGLTSRILKNSFEVLQDQLCHLFNVSLTTCTFPKSWKQANVVLIHKGQDKLNVNNYRPI